MFLCGQRDNDNQTSIAGSCGAEITGVNNEVEVVMAMESDTMQMKVMVMVVL